MELAFAVHACSDARVILLRGYDDEVSYQLVIGGEENTKVYLIRTDETSWPGDQESDTPDILSCTEIRAFLFRWDQEVLP